MDQAKLDKLRSMSDQVRIGGKGSARRKKKVLHKNATTDDKKLQTSLKKMGLNTIPTIEEVNMFKDDGNVIHFKNPKVQASLQANTFAISGTAETKTITEMLPSVLNQLGLNNLESLKKLASDLQATSKTDTADVDDDVPDLVEDFDEKCKAE